MSFKQVKKATYNTITDGLSAVSTGVTVVDKTMKYADNWMTKQLLIQEQGMEESIKIALELQAEEQKQERRDAIVESNKAYDSFIKAVAEQDKSRKELLENISPETLEKYKDLL